MVVGIVGVDAFDVGREEDHCAVTASAAEDRACRRRLDVVAVQGNGKPHTADDEETGKPQKQLAA